MLDSFIVPSWQDQIIRFIKNNPSFSVQVVILNDQTKTANSGNQLYKIFRRLDRALFISKRDCFNRVDVSDVLKGAEIIHTKPVRTYHTDEIIEHDLTLIKNTKPDILIRFGFRILKGEILKTPRFGVWSLHHGDNSVNRGGPPAFWEVVHGEPVTGVILQQLTSQLDGGKVLGKAFVRTDRTSFNRNQNNVYWAGVELFCGTLKTFLGNSDSGIDETNLRVSGNETLNFYSKPLYRDPSNFLALKIFGSFWTRRLKEFAVGLWSDQQWTIYYKFNADKIDQAIYRYTKLIPPRGTDWADPFVIYENEKIYIFFEELPRSKKNAHISYLSFDSNGKLIHPIPEKIIEEEFHLSYPFVFKREDQYFMITEAAQSKSVWLYRCESFPHKWVKYKSLMDDVEMYDPTLYFHEDNWYLFGTQKPFLGNSDDQYLHIYFARDLFGDWEPHPQNPVTRDVRGARSAGKIFNYDGKLIRPGQIGAPKYGYGIRFHQIVELSPTNYREIPLEDILPHWKNNLLATHTFNYQHGFSVIDAQEQK